MNEKHCCHISNKDMKINTRGKNERMLTTEIAINASGLWSNWPVQTTLDVGVTSR